MNFNQSFFFSLFIVLLLSLLAVVGVKANLLFLLGIAIPYLAVIIFFVGMFYCIWKWVSVPVPFRIPTTCGQQKSLPWVKANNLESPYNTIGVIVRMALEVLLFRSLFRNTKAEVREGPKVSYWSAKWLWLAAIVFHWAFLTVLLRHLRFFMEPVPCCLHLLESVDGFLQIGTPGVYMSGLALLAAAIYLLLRRVFIPQLRYISLPADYFPIFLIIGIALSGILMRHFYKVDIVAVKEFTLGIAGFRPFIPDGIGVMFYVHLFLICALFIYFPFSKLVHMAGVFLSPTRNLANN
ncbi:MAG: sulfate reduction electron transfer complex DsrMKJOP subunit DsrM, partial [Thermodesulfobacteriota bacterium]|nr:sulfate reduction electron transfer complex DsrMKJOP subunit DsrM [Thermodesulfobacteriota bacterium]